MICKRWRMTAYKTTMIKIDSATKTFRNNGASQLALSGVSFAVQAGERVALLGSSGSGKSTLIRAICGLEILDAGSGELLLNQKVVQSNGYLSKNIRQVRNHIGVIFQQFNLVGQLDVISNVLIGLCPHKNILQLLMRKFSDEEKAKALDALDKVGLIDIAYQRASTLSGGQQQRVAIARALVRDTKVILADEPVASLDPESSRKVMDTLVGLCEKFDLTLIASLHQLSIAKKYCQRTIALNAGKLYFDGATASLDAASIACLYGSVNNDLHD